MLDPRLYRTAFLPLIVAVVVVAFSLHSPPGAMTTTFSPDAFDGPGASRTLADLAAAFPDRRPGSAGDRRLSAAVAAGLRQDQSFRVTVRRFDGRTIDGERTLTTVIARRPGLSNRQIVLVAHRDASAHGAVAELSSTAALLELGHVLAGRATRHTVTLVSTSGGSGGDAGAAQLASDTGGPVDAAIVLGDLAGTATARPWVVGWSDGRGQAPIGLQATAAAAVGQEVGRPGGRHAAMQFLHEAFPWAVGEEAPLEAAGVPTVLIGPEGEREPAANEPASADRLRSFGRAVLRTLTAVDGAPEIQPVRTSAILVRGQLLPAWAVRWLVAALLLPAQIGAVDGTFRARRRGTRPGWWALWALAGAIPFLLLALVLLFLRVVGALGAPPAPVPAGVEPVSWGVLAVCVLVLAAGWGLGRLAVVRQMPLPRRGPEAVGGPGSGAGVALAGAVLTGLVWIVNPFAAAFLLPAVHLWLLTLASRRQPSRRLAIALVAAALLPLAIGALAYALVLDAGPVQFAWMTALGIAGGHVGVLQVLGGSALLGCAASALVVAVRRRPVPAESHPAAQPPLGRLAQPVLFPATSTRPRPRSVSGR